MGENSKIEWTHHTFNPWRGCQRVSPGCEHCYAEQMSKRNPAVLGEWGVRGTRVIGTDAYWREPLKWNRQAEAEGARRRVFCASLADVFENWHSLLVNVKGETNYGGTVSLRDARARLFALIRETPALDWLLLTKRPENIAGMLPADWGTGYPNVWLGTTVENQEYAEKRIPHLLAASAAVRFLSVEPMLGAVDLTRIEIVAPRPPYGPGVWLNALTGHYIGPDDMTNDRVDWVICGGESGGGSRPMHPDWARSLRDQCEATGVPFFFKQWGSWLPVDQPWKQDNPPKAGANERYMNLAGGHGYHGEEVWRMRRVDKKTAGRWLDGGREWSELPTPATKAASATDRRIEGGHI